MKIASTALLYAQPYYLYSLLPLRRVECGASHSEVSMAVRVSTRHELSLQLLYPSEIAIHVDALAKITEAWRQLRLMRTLFEEAAVKRITPLDSSGYPPDGSPLAPGTTVVVISGSNKLRIVTAARYAESLLLEQVRFLTGLSS